MNSGPLPDAFKAKVASLIQEQLKPIVTVLAAQEQTLLTHLALLKHDYNVNDYQMTRLENIRDLEQSINFKVSGALGFDAWDHPTIGTNLREPVPADPLKIPQFKPIEHATPAERAAESASLVAEAGVSARRLGVPLTMQDFPRDPVSCDCPKEDPMHSAVPLFGLEAPRWRAMQGLPPDIIPGTACYDGVVTLPKGKRGLQLYYKRAKQLRVPKCKTVAADADLPWLDAAPSGSSSSRAPGISCFGAPDAPASVGPFDNSSTPGTHATRMRAVPGPASSSAHIVLSRTATMASIGSTHAPSPSGTFAARSTLSRTSTSATIGSTISNPGAVAVPRSTLSRTSTMATVGSRTSEPGTTARAGSKTKAKGAGRARSKNETKRATGQQPPDEANPSSMISASNVAEQPKKSTTPLKRTRAAELDDDDDGSGATTATATPVLQPAAEICERKDDDESGERAAGPARKRRKRAAAANPGPGAGTVAGAGADADATGDESRQGQQQGQPRRSTRITRSTTAAEPAPRPPAPRGRATKSRKRTNV